MGARSPPAWGTLGPPTLLPGLSWGPGARPGWPPACVVPDYIQIARSFEATRQRCCRLEQDRQRARQQLAQVEAERAALEVKLKHARNQVEVEMKKRHRAEAELEKQVWGRLAVEVPHGAGC